MSYSPSPPKHLAPPPGTKAKSPIDRFYPLNASQRSDCCRIAETRGMVFGCIYTMAVILFTVLINIALR